MKLILGLLAVLPLAAQEAEVKPEAAPVAPPAQERGAHAGDREVHRQRLIQRFDKDKDGKLNEEEKAAMERFIEEHRRRGHSRAEGHRPRGGEHTPQGRPSREEILKRFDKDGDGKLSEEERAAMQQELGRRPRGERQPQGHPSREELMKRFDKDQDGKLDDEERAEMEKFLKGHRRGGKRPEGAPRAE